MFVNCELISVKTNANVIAEGVRKTMKVKPILINWKTTAAAVGMLVTAIAPALLALTDGNANTNVNWNEVMPAIFGAIALIFARDADK